MCFVPFPGGFENFHHFARLGETGAGVDFRPAELFAEQLDGTLMGMG